MIDKNGFSQISIFELKPLFDYIILYMNGLKPNPIDLFHTISTFKPIPRFSLAPVLHHVRNKALP